MSIGHMIDINSRVIIPEYLPNPYPYPAQPAPSTDTLQAILTNGDDAGNLDITNLKNLEVNQRVIFTDNTKINIGSSSTGGANPDIESINIGAGAGQNAGSQSINIGANSGITSASNSIAVGVSSQANTNSVSIGWNSSSATDCVAIGVNAGAGQIADPLCQSSVAIGNSCSNVSQGEFSVAIGFLAGNQEERCVAIGALAGGGGALTAIQQAESTCVGFEAGTDNCQPFTTVIGAGAGKFNFGSVGGVFLPPNGGLSVAVGYLAGETDAGVGSTNVGPFAGQNLAGEASCSFGIGSGNNCGIGSLNIGSGSGANSGLGSVNIGAQALAGDNGIAIGNNSGAGFGSLNSVSIGFTANAEDFAVAIGDLTQATQNSVVIGNACSSTTNNEQITIGNSSSVSGVQSIAIGRTNTNDGDISVILGNVNTIDTNNVNSIAIGINNYLAGVGAISNNIAIGNNNGNTIGSNNIILGSNCQSLMQDSNIIIGDNTGITGITSKDVIIGRHHNATLSNNNNILIGESASGTYNNCCAIGHFGANSSVGDNSVAIQQNGNVKLNLGNDCISIGDNPTGNNNIANRNIQIGKTISSNGNSNTESVALGFNIGASNSDKALGNFSVNIGTNLSNYHDGSSDSPQENVVIGINNMTTQVGGAVFCIGSGCLQASSKNTSFANSVVIGKNICQTHNIPNAGIVALGVNTFRFADAGASGGNQVCIGSGAGNRPAINCVNIGTSCGNYAGTGSVNLGNFAGFENLNLTNATSSSYINIGNGAGYSIPVGGVASHTISIGTNANLTNQFARCININASGTTVNSAGNDRCYIAPIRAVAKAGIASGGLHYDPITREVMYAP